MRFFFKHLPQALKSAGAEYDFVKVFEEITGVPLKLYICIGFLFWGHYEKNSFQGRLEFLKKTENYVVNNNLPIIKKRYLEQAKKALDILSADRATFNASLQSNVMDGGKKINYYQISPLIAHPVYKSANGNYFPLDLNFLLRKITMGVKWEIHDALLRKIKGTSDENEAKQFKKERNLLLGYYGKTMELYAADLFKRMVKKQKNTLLLYNKKRANEYGFDFLIYDLKIPDSVIIIELTTSWMHYNKVLSGNLSHVMKQFKNLFVKRDSPEGDDSSEEYFINKTSKEKIRQLDEAIKNFQNGKFSELNPHKNKVKKIYTVLLTEVGFPQFPGLTSRYRELIREHHLLAEHIENFQFLDLEELELIEALLNSKGEHRITDLLGKRVASPARDYPFKNFLHEDYSIMKCREMAKQYRGIVSDGSKYLRMDFKSRLENIIFAIKRLLSDFGIGNTV
jgi:hypothetical protein